MQNASNLVWVDMEMTGLDPDGDVVIEIATIVTDTDLNTLAPSRKSPSLQRSPDCASPGKVRPLC